MVTFFKFTLLRAINLRKNLERTHCCVSMVTMVTQVRQCYVISKKYVKCTLVQALRLCTGRTAHKGSRGIALLFLNHGTRRGWGVSVTPRRLFPPVKTRYPLYRSLSGPQGRSEQVRKISPPPGFDPRTVEPVASRYTVCAIRPNSSYICTIVNTKCSETRTSKFWPLTAFKGNVQCVQLKSGPLTKPWIFHVRCYL